MKYNEGPADKKAGNKATESISLCIIDEAPQCTETAILVPLRYPIDKLVLIGDPCQLGPVILDPNLT